MIAPFKSVFARSLRSSSVNSVWRSFHQSPSCGFIPPNRTLLRPSILSIAFPYNLVNRISPLSLSAAQQQFSTNSGSRPKQNGKKGIGREKQEERKKFERSGDARGLLQFIGRNIDDFNGRDMATAWNALKGITNQNHLQRIRKEPVFLDLVKRLTEMIASNDTTLFLNAIELSMIASAATKIGRLDGTDELFAAISKQSIWIVNHVNAQALANIATAYSKLEITNHQDFFAAISDKDVSRWIVENWNAQEIANIATAFAKLEVVDHKNFFAAINDEKIIKYLMGNGNAQVIANIATAFAKLEIDC